MTATANSDEQQPSRESLIDIRSEVPGAALVGDQIRCRWQLTNNGETTVAASFYLRTTPARLVSLATASGRLLRGHFHGNATVHIPRFEPVTISAELEPVMLGENEVRVAVMTRDATHERIDIITIIS